MSLATGSGVLRIYTQFHPDARVNFVEHRGRTVWMTQKQFEIWKFVKDYHNRGKRLTTGIIAARCHCSRATVSRFLRRLDLWRFIDLASWVGRRGGVWVKTRKATTRERDAWLAGARHTWESRKKARDLLIVKLRREWERKVRDKYHAPDYRGVQLDLALSSTDATFIKS
jgi:hypothetical protein